MIIPTAVGAGNAAGYIRCYMVSAGPCVLQQARASLVEFVAIGTYGTVYRCVRGHAHMTRLYDVIFVIFFHLCQHYAQCLCIPIMLKIMLA